MSYLVDKDFPFAFVGLNESESCKDQRSKSGRLEKIRSVTRKIRAYLALIFYREASLWVLLAHIPSRPLYCSSLEITSVAV